MHCLASCLAEQWLFIQVPGVVGAQPVCSGARLLRSESLPAVWPGWNDSISCASLSPSVKWGYLWYLLQRDFRRIKWERRCSLFRTVLSTYQELKQVSCCCYYYYYYKVLHSVAVRDRFRGRELGRFQDFYLSERSYQTLERTGQKWCKGSLQRDHGRWWWWWWFSFSLVFGGSIAMIFDHERQLYLTLYLYTEKSRRKTKRFQLPTEWSKCR